MHTKLYNRIAKRNWIKNFPDARRRCNRASNKANLKSLYGITADYYFKLMFEQNFSCAICKRHQTEFRFPLHVDHDHRTKQVRGLLCNKCNVQVGFYETTNITPILQYLGK